MKTTVLIRPAARGGKYLGPDAATTTGVSAIIALLNPNTYDIISAKVVSTKNADAGPANLMDPISRSQPYATDDNTVNAIFTVDITEPTTFLVAVFGPIKYMNQVRATYTEITVFPGVNIGTSLTPEGIVVEIPGLCIGNVTANLSGNQLSASAQVTMMCGCKIAPGSNWPPTDFNIYLMTQDQSGHLFPYKLDYDNDPANPSSFKGSWNSQTPNQPIVKAWIMASEPKLGNQGVYWLTGGQSNVENHLLNKVQQYLISKNN